MLKQILAVIVMLGCSALALAQTQPEQTPEPEQSDDSATAIGAGLVRLPEGWFSFPDSATRFFVSNIDLMAVGESEEYGDGTVIVQIDLLNNAMIGAAVVNQTLTATELLNLAAGSESANLEIVPASLAEKDAVKAEYSTPNFSQEIYSIVLDEGIYSLSAVVGVGEGTLAAEDANIIALLGSLGINYDGSMPDDAIDYGAIPQGKTADGFPLLGNPDAAVSIQEISSFSCPHCGTFHTQVLPGLVNRIATEDINFVYVPFFRAGNIGSGEAAALAGVCALEQGRFWEYHDALFSWQQYGAFAFALPRLLNGAEALGLDVAQFEACYASEETLAAITAADAYARTIEGFAGTPTLIVNGTIVNSAADVLNAAIDAALGAE
jgi:protein-disulfide isomerase